MVYNTSQKTQKKKKASFIELLCRCFMGSSNNHQPPDEKSTQEELESKQLGPQFEHQKGKKTLILDLDETLVHSSFQPMSNSDYTLAIKVQNIPFTIHVKKRPGVEYFLEKASEFFEVVIYTASLAEYADPVCDLIDPRRIVSYRLFRENCTNYQGLFVKDLSKIGRDMKDILIVDVQDVRTTKGWMEKYLTLDYIDYISMKGEYLKYNKKQQLKKQRSLMNAEGSQIPLIQQQTMSISREDSQTIINQVSTNNPHSNSKNTSTVNKNSQKISNGSNNNNNNNNNNSSSSSSAKNETGSKDSLNKKSSSSENDQLKDISNNLSSINKDLSTSSQTQSGLAKKYKKKDLQIQVPAPTEENKQKLENEEKLEQDVMIEEYNQKLSFPNNLNSVRTNKLESTRKLLERGTPRTDDYFVHKTCPDEEQSYKDPNRLNKSFEKVRYDIGLLNINSPIAQKDFIDFLKEPIQTSPKLNKISNYFASQKQLQPLQSNKFCDNLKLKLLMQQTQQIEEQEIDIDPNSLQMDQIILDRNHNSELFKTQNKNNEFDKQLNPNKKCEIINFTDDNIKN